VAKVLGCDEDRARGEAAKNGDIALTNPLIVAFATADTDTAKRISEMAGQKTEKRRSGSYRLGAWMRGSQNH
jgi:type IV secretory pathway TraG/TraD family ATPase VirD4